VLILTAKDRNRLGYKTGLYEVCAYGNDDSSFAITPTEDNFNQRFDALDKYTYTFNIESKNFMYFRHTHEYLARNA
jgi:hypothetical protein